MTTKTALRPSVHNIIFLFKSSHIFLEALFSSFLLIVAAFRKGFFGLFYCVPYGIFTIAYVCVCRYV